MTDSAFQLFSYIDLNPLFVDTLPGGFVFRINFN